MPKQRTQNGLVKLQGNADPHVNTIILAEDSFATQSKDRYNFAKQFETNEERRIFKSSTGLNELTNSIIKEIDTNATFRSKEPWSLQRNSCLNNYTDGRYIRIKQNHQYIRIENLRYQDKYYAPAKIYVIANTKFKPCQSILQQNPEEERIWGKIRPRISEIYTARTFSRVVDFTDKLEIYEMCPTITNDKVRNFRWYFVLYKHDTHARI